MMPSAIPAWMAVAWIGSIMMLLTAAVKALPTLVESKNSAMMKLFM